MFFADANYEAVRLYPYGNILGSFQVVYGGSIYQSLRIPDTGGHGYQTLDALLLTDR